MSNSEIVNNMSKDINLYRGICYNITKGDGHTEDLIQDIFLIILEYDNEKLNDTYSNNKLRYLFATIARRQFYKKSNKFAIQYRHETRRDDFDVNLIDTYENYNGNSDIYEAFITDDYNDTLNHEISNDNFNSIVSTLEHKFTWYDVELFKMYWKLGDYNIIDGYKRDINCKNEHSSYRKMARRTNIHYLSIQQSVSSTTKELKQILNSPII